MPEFYMILARKIIKIPEFYMIFCPKNARILHNNCPKNIFSRIFAPPRLLRPWDLLPRTQEESI